MTARPAREAAAKVAQRPVKDLVYDIGMHRGEDTAYYLAKGYRVVAVEANPELVRECRERFAEPLEDGSLTIVEGAIAEGDGDEATFYVDSNSLWGSVDPGWVERKQVMRPQRPISVPRVDLAACIRRHGVPHYMKIDVEGADRICLEALEEVPQLPDYLSMEAEPFDFDAVRADLDLLKRLGYRRFAVVRQGEHGDVSTRTLSGEPLTYRFPPDSSGPFGDDLPGRWVSRRAAMRRHRRAYRHRAWGQRLIKSKLMVWLLRPVWGRSPRFRQLFVGYYDTHATRK